MINFTHSAFENEFFGWIVVEILNLIKFQIFGFDFDLDLILMPNSS
jgi:hypothetical protein